jgi:uncharacterized protein YjbI with pentapeptide repeats
MANLEHVQIVKQGTEAIRRWRENNPDAVLDLRGADLAKANLAKSNLANAKCCNATFVEANLKQANLSDADLSEADLRGAQLEWADLFRANISHARLERANLQEARLFGANLTSAKFNDANLASAMLSGANLTDADLRGADLRLSHLVEVNLTRANLNRCRVYGISAWKVIVDGAVQTDLIITPGDEPPVTTDNLKVAQFLYLLLHNQEIRDVLEIVTSKVVLILGRFTDERKAVLDALADELRKHNLLPIIFDFERSPNRDFTETIKILAGLSLFVIVDITKPKSAPQELTAIVPDYQIPFVPILEEGEDQYSMFEDFKKYDWVLRPIRKYGTKEVLLANFRNVILEPALEMHKVLQRKKNEEFEAMSIEDMIAQKEESVP